VLSPCKHSWNKILSTIELKTTGAEQKNEEQDKEYKNNQWKGEEH